MWLNTQVKMIQPQIVAPPVSGCDWPTESSARCHLSSGPAPRCGISAALPSVKLCLCWALTPSAQTPVHSSPASSAGRASPAVKPETINCTLINFMMLTRSVWISAAEPTKGRHANHQESPHKWNKEKPAARAIFRKAWGAWTRKFCNKFFFEYVNYKTIMFRHIFESEGRLGWPHQFSFLYSKRFSLFLNNCLHGYI